MQELRIVVDGTRWTNSYPKDMAHQDAAVIFLAAALSAMLDNGWPKEECCEVLTNALKKELINNNL